MSGHVFVYGTLKPGQHRWPALAVFHAGERFAARAPGLLFDPGWGWPVAVFDPDRTEEVPGVVVEIRPGSVQEALGTLDDIEGVAAGLFRRILIDVDGQHCWAYHWPGGTAAFRRIPSWPPPPPG